MNNYFAFTLAEVLITLGLIGVVAAMTIPAVINNTGHKELEVGLQKGYAILQQAVQRMVYEEGMDISAANYPANTFAPVLKKYLKEFGNCGQKDCVSADITSEDGPAYNMVSRYKTYNKSRYVTLEWFDEGQAILTDGMFIMINNSDNASFGVVVSIDVNGYNKGPNLWGHDLFSFQIYKQKVIPVGSPLCTLPSGDSWNSYACDINSSERNNGMGCTYRALTEKDYFKNLP